MKELVALGCGMIVAFGCIMILEHIEKRRRHDEREVTAKPCD